MARKIFVGDNQLFLGYFFNDLVGLLGVLINVA
jgi:hypothetical protein